MNKIHTYKGLDGAVKLYGYIPIDLAVIFMSVIVFLAIFERPFMTLFVLWLALFIGKKIANRKRRFIKSLFIFIITPKYLRLQREAKL